ncbi:nicotinate-nucleotide--dimethylbenzimidazole phosphoribosyltransferase [Actinorugispora endophytica]|uniref:Nicotinate-nucleotide--dimethylbenzimidazole phosphoribosyltransferase n=1 Tax=Actinorugispora endophytica TaxID=1605990 RepID=A0A4R6USX2_9ACTN|nr:nicotinate-nucleotide--dimethylbenzimidazole phosphoribosyltransferase [Actinorugispora endophytica]TDQ48773.1 nicotinate-nucleotide-dimethylbenzimidazole phosphoribosyltransferase /cob(II)yrinic acid a,c-diamide reductase [Actinorugispora endophytica]
MSGDDQAGGAAGAEEDDHGSAPGRPAARDAEPDRYGTGRWAAVPFPGDAQSPGGLLDGLPEQGQGAGPLPPLPLGGNRDQDPFRAGPPEPPRPSAAPWPDPLPEEGTDRPSARTPTTRPQPPAAAPAPEAPPEPGTRHPAPPPDTGGASPVPDRPQTRRNVIPFRGAAASRPANPRGGEAPEAARPPEAPGPEHASPPATRRPAEPEDRSDQVNEPAAPSEPVDAPRPPEAGPAEPVEPVEPVEEAPEGPVDGEVIAEPVGSVPDPVEPQPSAPRRAHAYGDAEREAVYRAIRERRDVRVGFRPDPVSDEVLVRILEAAHQAPSVGFSQPWDFVVIRDPRTRARVRDLVRRQREEYARALPGARARAFSGLKVEAVLDTPVNIVVTVDPTRGGRHTLGRRAQPQTAGYSAALAVENLWLAARAEGLGVGWVSFFAERDLARELDLPPHLEVVAYLCVGHVDDFPPEPELSLGGWAQRRPLSWAVHSEHYGQRGLPGEEPTSLLEETVAGISPLNRRAVQEARERQARMTKPAGSLGVLEDVSVQLAGLAGECPAPIPEPAAVAVFAGDHGVHAQGVTPWPQEVTAQMVRNFLDGGAVVNAFAAQVGAEVTIVDVGVVSDLPAVPGLLPRKIARGTADMTRGPAMSRLQAGYAIEAGIEVARDLVAAGNRCLVTGDMGIANTTASAALIAVFTGRDAAEVTGRGTGVDDGTHARKIEVVRAALRANPVDPADPVGVLAAVGGLEHAALAGFVLGAAAMRVPVLLDGVIAGAAALAAAALAPEAMRACVAGHRSSEPGHAVVLEHLGLRPLVDLELRLGEGSGALLALPLVQSAARALRDVATFDSASVSERE